MAGTTLVEVSKPCRKRNGARKATWKILQPLRFLSLPLQDLQLIYMQLCSMEALSKLRESALRSLCAMVRYERHAANDILYW